MWQAQGSVKEDNGHGYTYLGNICPVTFAMLEILHKSIKIKHNLRQQLNIEIILPSSVQVQYQFSPI